MKKFIILIAICCVQNIFSQTIPKGNSTQYKTEAPVGNVSSNAQAVTEEDNQIYNTAGIDVRPEFPGGVEAMNGFIKQNFKSPKENLKGKIYATFIIEKDGSLSDIKILRDIGYETGAEAIRVLKLFPKWSPGKQNNKTIRVLYSIPMLIN
ncbi:energy transducer TonB [Flavobacterium sp. 245]|uniref:energy transducer TonB n=1 Tax=Flavobacterium sp. 245 TaxID=2512115 RepID=UPI00105E81F1|nr:energy transducer TonB [Flavobacterium sp. 245]TDP02544.1 TonB-like protein [Flavobacterium sp. 245]